MRLIPTARSQLAVSSSNSEVAAAMPAFSVQQADPAVGVVGDVGEVGHGVEPRHVRDHTGHLEPFGPRARDGAVEAFGVHIREDNFHAAAPVELPQGQTNAPSATGDHGNTAFELLHLILPRPRAYASGYPGEL
jgi:hypothetical protein